MGCKVQSEKLHAPGGGRQEAGEHFDGSGFARAIGAQKTEELAGRDLEIDFVHSGEAAEAPRELVRRDSDRRHDDSSSERLKLQKNPSTTPFGFGDASSRAELLLRKGY